MGELTDRPAVPGLLGACPRCGTTIPTEATLIEYESAGGWPQVFAECPSCRDVVHPR